jgi:hypothetical protein
MNPPWSSKPGRGGRRSHHPPDMKPPDRSSLLASTVYVLMLAGAVLAFLWIRERGETLVVAAGMLWRA